ncbi:lipid kinase, YegS/Rv2252/BmrU family [Evansella caseinilytica]|uniref:Lipid kinase, YegS/Rv2252/BmrU family n=1 Tax=Evansella caseinilytica TaxID=1503961 RepID=A0A1H3NLM4_9BACI|nr:diacylglycerol kinase family protein [Evansella caseinilytica]SDY89325.1 lipid kinase, YegS/Rv2252/BmrU family [Evansella caseinilytica]
MYIVIINSYSGKRRTNKIFAILSTMLPDSFVAFSSDLYQEKDMWNAIHNKIAEMKQTVKGFLIVGGDGTLHQAVQQLHSYHLPFGLIPSGSGNDFGRALSIPMNAKKALERIVANQPGEYDLIDVNGKKVLSVAGIGVDAETAIRCRQSQLKKMLNMAFLGRLSYLMMFLKTVLRYKPSAVHIIDRHGANYHFQRVWLIAAGNTGYYGGGIPICPNAKPDDGQIDLVIVHGLGLFQLLVALPAVFVKKHLTLPYITMLTGNQFTVTAQRTLPVQGDGEEVGETPATIHILPKAIRIF